MCRRIPLLSQLHDTEEERAHLFHVRGLNGRFHLSSVVVVVVTVLHVFLLFVMVSMRARRFFVMMYIFFHLQRVKKVWVKKHAYGKYPRKIYTAIQVNKKLYYQERIDRVFSLILFLSLNPANGYTLNMRCHQSSLCPLALSLPTNCLYPNHSKSPGHFESGSGNSFGYLYASS